ncbi:MAG: acyltransferase [Prevotellamassilia sp.]|nr:acyltransferase [Prevotellamassilia sp.]
MRSIVQSFIKLVFPLLPETRCFALKRSMLRWAGAKVGRNVRVCSSVMIVGAGELEIGDNTWIGHRCLISASSSVRIGKNVDIAPNVFIGNGTHGITPDRDRIADVECSRDVEVGDGCWLCAGSMVLPGVSLGAKCVVAAGSVVTRSFGPMKLLAGVPACIKRELGVQA